MNASVFPTVMDSTKLETNQSSALTREGKLAHGDRLADDGILPAATSRTHGTIGLSYHHPSGVSDLPSKTVSTHRAAFKSNSWGDQSTETSASDRKCDLKRSTTVIRKQFHIVAVAIFVPGLIYDPQLLYMASTCALVVLIMVEVCLL